MFHIFKHHDEWVALHTHAIEGDNVFVLQVGEELGLSVEVRPAALAGLLQSLAKKSNTQRQKKQALRSIVYKHVCTCSQSKSVTR